MNRRGFLIGAGAAAAAAALPAVPMIPDSAIGTAFIEIDLLPMPLLRSYARRLVKFSLGPGAEMPIGAQVFVDDIEFAVDEIIHTASETLIAASEVLKPGRFEARGSFKWIDPEDAKW